MQCARSLTPVYPRPCGGAYTFGGVDAFEQGLSPPVRGSRRDRTHIVVHDGSIPARAGEPRTDGGRPRSEAVYPRPCGGADLRIESAVLTYGLSPPVRGSRSRAASRRHVGGSIPARAGEPYRVENPDVGQRVYPRPCGGAHHNVDGDSTYNGLSPPVRGSHPVLLAVRTPPRSIPARAGEPGPASCGRRVHYGLSPPVRGSRHHDGH